MKLRRALSGLFGVLVLASAVGAPQATAGDCRWIPHDLPLPAGAVSGHTLASSSDNSLVLGTAYQDGIGQGVVWWNGDLRPMAPPPPSAGHVLPKGINKNWVVVGSFRTQEDGKIKDRAFRYQNGQYELLPTEPYEQSEAVGINDAGDIVGTVWDTVSPNWRTAVVWPVNEPRRSFDIGEPIGVTSDRKVVTTKRLGSETYWVIDIVTGTRTQLQTARTPWVLDNDRILHFAFTTAGTSIIELGLDGQRTAEYVDGIEPYGRTSSGVLLGTSGPGKTTLWQWGGHHDVDSEKSPKPGHYGDITDEGALIGTYENADGTTHPARWFWCG